MIERKIVIDDVINCINTGEIIEQYEDDKPFSSCLILGNSVQNNKLHVVISKDEEFIYVITAYYPDKDQWEEDFRTRKK